METIPGTGLLGGSWDLVSKATSTIVGVVSHYRFSYASNHLNR